MNLYQRSLVCLTETDPESKVELVKQLEQDWLDDKLSRDDAESAKRLEIPGRPDKPELVPPADVPKRKASSEAGRLRLVHAIAHIEFNAINLALDAVYRFREMPDQYYTEWLQVAREEALHFSLLQQYLTQRGVRYGDFPAHNGLWEMAVKTDHDVLIRMALVPRVLEARGLDVTPAMSAQLERAGDKDIVDILAVIFRDEVGHVSIGNHWYRYCCEQRGLDTVRTFFQLVDQHLGKPLAGPFEHEARLRAGFTETELELLEAKAP